MAPDDVLFLEHHAAAQSLKNAWTRLASTYGCMMVVLSPEMLRIRPHWFAKWMIGLMGLDLSHEIPVSRIKSVTETGKWFGYGKVELQYEPAPGDSRTILLYLKQYSEFIHQVNGL